MGKAIDKTGILPPSPVDSETCLRRLTEAKKEFTAEVEKMRTNLRETLILLQRVPQSDQARYTPLVKSQAPSNFIIAVMLLNLCERNDQIEMLHKQVARHTKKIAELNDLVQEYDRHLKYSRQVLDQILAEVSPLLLPPDQGAIDVTVEQLVQLIKDHKKSLLRFGRKRSKSPRRRSPIKRSA